MKLKIGNITKHNIGPLNKDAVSDFCLEKRTY